MVREELGVFFISLSCDKLDWSGGGGKMARFSDLTIDLALCCTSVVFDLKTAIFGRPN